MMARSVLSRVRRASATALFAFLSLGLAACVSTEPPPVTASAPEIDPAMQARLHQWAERAFADRRYEDAQREYIRILSADPSDKRAGFGLAEVFLATGRPNEAEPIFEKLVSSPEFGGRALAGKGISLLAVGRDRASLDALEQAVSLDPGLWRAWNALGQIYDSRDEWDKAKSSYDRAIALAPDEPIIRNNVGVSLMLQTRYAEAEAIFAAVLQRVPESEIISNNLRLSLAFQGRYLEAMAGVRREDTSAALNNVGYVAILRGDYDHAEAYLSRALEHSAEFSDTAWKNMQYLESVKELASRDVAPAVEN